MLSQFVTRLDSLVHLEKHEVIHPCSAGLNGKRWIWILVAPAGNRKDCRLVDSGFFVFLGVSDDEQRRFVA